MDQPVDNTPNLVLCRTLPPGKDEWRGKSDTRERKRIQNRINQRARRSRQRKQLDDSDTSPYALATSSRSSYGSVPDLIDAVWRQEISLKALVDAFRVLDLRSEDNMAIIKVFETIALQTRISNAPIPTMLSSLGQFNVLQAVVSNADIFGLTSEQMDDDALSPFNIAGPWPPSAHVGNGPLPSGLRPTALQFTVEHHPWIDLMPVPQLRDNILQRGPEFFDEVALCRAFTGLGHEQGTGLLVWGESWDESSWEVTQAFAESWGFLLAGCLELCRSTNRHRARRGECPLFRLDR